MNPNSIDGRIAALSAEIQHLRNLTKRKSKFGGTTSRQEALQRELAEKEERLAMLIKARDC